MINISNIDDSYFFTSVGAYDRLKKLLIEIVLIILTVIHILMDLEN